MTTFIVNGESRTVDVPPTHPLLWVLREQLRLQGTKFGCGIGQCGACTVLMNGQPIRSCQFPVGQLEGADITTIEGLPGEGTHPVQEAWIEEQVPQCGYCQSGQILSAVALLERNPEPTDADIDTAMAGNVCRCGAYVAIRRAIHRAAELRIEGRATDEDGAGEAAAGASSVEGADR
jgi:aerobic-type carbon monoxide dehydrogenase small subunit (CoxS/CutS family)